MFFKVWAVAVRHADEIERRKKRRKEKDLRTEGINISLPTLLRLKELKRVRHHLSTQRDSIRQRGSRSLRSGGRSGVVLVDVLLDALIEDAVGLEDEIDGVAPGAFATCMGSDVMGGSLHLVTGGGDGDGQPPHAHYGQVDHIVSHVGDLLEGK